MGDRGNLLSKALKRIAQYVLSFPIVAFSGESISVLKKFNCSHPEFLKRTLLVRNCPSKTGSPRLPCIRRNSKVILTVGRIGSPQKATDVLLKAWLQAADACPDWRLKLVGPYSSDFHQEWLQRLVCAGLTDRVEWTGMISDKDELRAIYAEAPVFVLPSRWEGASIALVEAVTAGCAVIATPVGEALEILGKDSTGLVPVDDVLALAYKLVLFASDEALRREQQQKMQDVVNERQWDIQLSLVAKAVARKCGYKE
jgi:glycosyltransferase involved in cell wall biosynthesis